MKYYYYYYYYYITYIIITGSTTQPVVELVEWQTAESEVSGSNPRARF